MITFGVYGADTGESVQGGLSLRRWWQSREVAGNGVDSQLTHICRHAYTYFIDNKSLLVHTCPHVL